MKYKSGDIAYIVEKCFLLEFGESKQFSFGRCSNTKSFNELYDGLKNIE